MGVGKRPLPLVLILLLVLTALGSAACQSSLPATDEAATIPVVTTSPPLLATDAAPKTEAIETAVTPAAAEGGETAVNPSSDSTAFITIDVTAQSQPIDRRVLGTNLPAWIGADKTEDETFIARTMASGVSLIRIPGGSWSNGYDWLACETGTDISGDSEACWSWPWGSRPTDFLNFIKATGTEAMYTVNLNGTAKEAAALVAFFNGSVDDDSEIGLDVRGRDWGKVNDWAQLRSDHGNPDPLPIRYWEIGNEIYGGQDGLGKDCAPWGWEEVWTCDGREYVNGIGQGSDRHEGFLEFRTAMQAVDPTILVGAVGVTPSADWNEWGLEVIEETGSALDFYIIHEYGYFDPPESYAAMLAQPQEVWPSALADVNGAYAGVGNGRTAPIAVTEYNLFAVEDQDNQQMMKQAANMLFLADTIGQMLQGGVAMANQWNLVNGEAGNGTDYGLMDAETFFRHPQYYVFPLWSRFGDRMLPAMVNLPADSTLSVYVGLVDDRTVSLLAINKTGTAVSSEIYLKGVQTEKVTVLADVVQAPSLDSQTVTVNGVAEQADDLADAPASTFSGNIPLSYTFAPYSITLLRIMINE